MGDPYRKQKRAAVIVISIFLLVVVAVSVTIGMILGIKSVEKEEPKHGNITAKKAIAAVCEPTENKERCIHRLESHAGNTTDPEELVRVVFRLAMKQLRRAGNATVTLKELEKDPRTNSTLHGCKQLMNKSIRELKRSYKRLGETGTKKTHDKLLADLKIWLSATITYQETCLDGFENKNSTSAKKMRESLNNSLELSRNSIAMVSTVAEVLALLKFSGDIDALFDPGSRRLLQYDNADVLDFGEIWDVNGDIVGHGKRRRLLKKELDTEPSSHSSEEHKGNPKLPEPVDLYKFKPTFVVAKDGTGRFTTINDALLRVPKESEKPTVIYIKEGVYNEIVHISSDMHHLFLIGDGAEKTRITGILNYVDGTPTWKTATFAVSGEYFMAKNIGFENSAGPTKRQAVALRVDADMAIFYNCTMDGYQGTLLAHAKRQFYRDCTISGTVDVVFGDASAVFQNCNFIIRKPLEKQDCIVTAQGRNYTFQPTAFIIQNSTITADPGFLSVKAQHKAYLGRPWRPYSRTIIMESFIDGLIDPEGWVPWNGEKGTDTCYYAEVDNHGPGADKTRRVNWEGVKNLSLVEAQKFTAGRFIEGDDWITTVALPYNSGLFSNQTDHNNNNNKTATT